MNTVVTSNEGWGFWGTVGDLAKDAWPVAMDKIADATCMHDESVGLFLDSKYGRHFGDEFLNAFYHGQSIEDSITETVDRWMSETLSRNERKAMSIPRGLPKLIALVTFCEINNI